MIQLFKEDGTKVESVKTRQELYDYITHLENLRILEALEKNPPKFPQSPWSFTARSREEVAYLLQHNQIQHNIPIMMEAFEKGLGLLEICKGDCNNLIHIILTRDIDVEALKYTWCQDFCKAFGYVLSEVTSPADFNKAEGEHTGG
ncbi:MAG: hypothetical protein K0R52_446 [Alphaproteobacteria bacterium]|jgi:hypothetical protein|nr:hypothetical protein [Alphaproteobacteria bacterium]